MKKKWLRWISLGAVCCPQFLGAAAVNGTWNQSAAGAFDWNLAGDWVGGNIPGIVGNNGDTAQFNALTGAETVHLNGATTFTLQSMTITNATAFPYLFDSTGGSFSFLANPAGPSTLIITAGTPPTTISANIANGSATQPLNFALAAGTSLSISGVLSSSGGSIFLTDVGTLALSGAGSMAAGTGLVLQVSGATFDISGAAGDRSLVTLTGVAGSVITLGANTLTITNNAVFSGSIGGTGGLTLSGPHTSVSTLSGALLRKSA